ncbi:hypothetical protein HGA89_02375, partial [bacterium]|nr:hypothetical protein [bacterium]
MRISSDIGDSARNGIQVGVENAGQAEQRNIYIELHVQDLLGQAKRETLDVFVPANAWTPGVPPEALKERWFLMGRARRVSIFLSLLDVHVNRSPVSGEVGLVSHRAGTFHQAFRPEASESNEHNLLGIVHGDDRILVKQ